MFVKSSYADFCKSAEVGVISCALLNKADDGGPHDLELGQQAFDGTVGVGLLSALHKPSSALDAAGLLLGSSESLARFVQRPEFVLDQMRN